MFAYTYSILFEMGKTNKSVDVGNTRARFSSLSIILTYVRSQKHPRYIVNIRVELSRVSTPTKLKNRLSIRKRLPPPDGNLTLEWDGWELCRSVRLRDDRIPLDKSLHLFDEKTFISRFSGCRLSAAHYLVEGKIVFVLLPPN